MQSDADDRGIDLGCGHEAVGGHGKEMLGLAVVGQHRRDGAVIPTSCLGAEAVRHLGLDHDGDVVEGEAALEQLH